MRPDRYSLGHITAMLRIMPGNNIKSFEIETFKKKLTKLAESQAIADAIFADVVYTAMSQCGLDEDMFRNEFGLTKGAVNRWTQEQNLPQPMVRPKILLWIEEQL